MTTWPLSPHDSVCVTRLGRKWEKWRSVVCVLMPGCVYTPLYSSLEEPSTVAKESFFSSKTCNQNLLLIWYPEADFLKLHCNLLERDSEFLKAMKFYLLLSAMVIWGYPGGSSTNAWDECGVWMPGMPMYSAIDIQISLCVPMLISWWSKIACEYRYQWEQKY